MPKKTPDSSSSTENPEAKGTAADTIRAVLRNKANGNTARGGVDKYGADQKPPRPPHGTRRSMGKR